MAGHYSEQEEVAEGADWPSPNTGLKMGKKASLSWRLGRMEIPGKVGRGRSVAPLRKTLGYGPNVQGVEGGAWEDCVGVEGAEKNLSQFEGGWSSQIALDLGPDSLTDCALSRDGGFGSQDQ